MIYTRGLDTSVAHLEDNESAVAIVCHLETVKGLARSPPGS
jgi:hypothetical protein